MPDQPAENKMVTGSGAKRLFHFSGDGVYHNLALFASNLEEATKEWLAKRRPIVPPAQQSTSASEAEPKTALQ